MLQRIRTRLAADLGRAGAAPEPIFDCLVAVTEACSNALRHGTGPAAPRLSWVIEDDRARFVVQDFSGAAWTGTPGGRDWTHAAAVDERVGGFGLSLMRGLMDVVDVRTGKSGTLVELAKTLR